jgi:hypothetical protein
VGGGLDKDLKGLVKRADKGDAKALSELRDYLGARPDLWERLGNVAATAAEALVSTGFAPSLQREAIYRKLDDLRKELAGPSPTPLEQLCVERIVACWLQVNYSDGIYVTALKDRVGIRSLEFHQRRQESAHRRFLSAVRTLALVRRLPILQLNIGAQQVNVAASK